MHLSLTPKLEKYVKAKIDNGLYNNASEVVREALRLMQEHEALRRLKRERLKKAIAKGEADLANGRFTDIKDDDDLTKFFARL
jgi:antitoxin ParD1/3/4